MSKKQMGFTLIEIVMVLVLLGILSAVAVPKYFDLQERALNSAAQATVAEVQARLNARFAAALMAGQKCSDAVNTAFNGNTKVTEAEDEIGADGAYGEHWSIKTLTKPTDNSTTTPITVTYKADAGDEGKDFDSFAGVAFKITVPACTLTSTTP